MGLGSFFKGLGGALGGALGITGSRNNAAAEHNVSAFGDTLKSGQNQYNQQLAGLNADNQSLANTDYMAGAQSNFQNQQDAYNQQQGAANMLYNQATGNAPSVADLQMQAGLGNANNQSQSAMLSQQGGVSPGLSQRNMLAAQAQQNANIVAAGQAARAGEMNQAQQNYANSLQNLSATGANMTDQQMQLGNFGYQQGQNALNYQTTNANNQQQVNAANAQNLLSAQQGNINSAAQANQAQSAALMNTISAAATGGASLAAKKPG